MDPPLLSLTLHHEQDVVTARQRAGEIAASLGFERSEQTRIATAVSEIVRNAFRYTGSGAVDFSIAGDTPPQLFVIKVTDRGSGIANLDDILGGRYRSTTGMGMGLIGARRLMDRCQIETSSSGTTVTLTKFLPRRAPFFSPDRRVKMARDLGSREPASLVEEVQRQNQDLLRALDELARRQEELVRLNRELEDTNRGVVALYAELDEKADHLRRADELKSRFLSNMTHEFRTPVNAILALTSLLEHRPTPEPEVQHIRRAAEQLSELVNDLLDLAKVEAGKTVVRTAEFDVANLFGALRGMLRPLLVNQSVTLTFEEPSGVPTMHTDEGKVSQILRNFISNALKYTEHGRVVVMARLDVEREEVIFAVSDTGIGIAPDDQERIFDEFAQVEHALQRKVKGTGLGLPLSKRLTELLGGRLTVTSEPGVGSTFEAAIPIRYRAARLRVDQPALSWAVDPGRLPVLVIEDGFETQLFYDKVLKGTAFQLFPARSLADAREGLARMKPRAIMLDILLNDVEAWDFLVDLKQRPETSDIPVIVISTVNDTRKGLSLGADRYVVKPVERQWLLDTLTELTGTTPSLTRVLVVDDQPAMRHVIGQLLDRSRYTITEAATGEEGLRLAAVSRPDVILLDLGLPDMDGGDVLTRLTLDLATARTPVVIVSSRPASHPTFADIAARAASVVSKDRLTAEVLHGAITHALASLASATEAAHG
jgi:signal transduction histidine kinase/DNA-binding response OmpR family regulator